MRRRLPEDMAAGAEAVSVLVEGAETAAEVLSILMEDVVSGIDVIDQGI